MESKETMKSVVSLVYCDSYDETKVYDAVKAALGYLGGIGNFVKDGERVLVKPNFLYPATGDKCITTHPSVIKAVIRLLTEGGYSFKCGDSPANGTCSTAFDKLGLDKSCIAAMNEEDPDSEFHFAKDVAGADAIIGVCKMKTHALMRITGAVKNMYGLICGARKAVGHVSYPSASSFAKMLVGIHKATPQRLHIMDAIVAMEGNGPASGTPVNMNLILVSADPVALDTVFCHLINLDPALVPSNSVGYVEGLGTYKEDEIEILLEGMPISARDLAAKYGKADFDVQRENDKLSILSIWSHLTGHFGKKPRIDASKCVKCGVCVDHCPVEGRAVHFENGKDQPPKYDYSKCIRCYCCQEICPSHAIYSK